MGPQPSNCLSALRALNRCQSILFGLGLAALAACAPIPVNAPHEEADSAPSAIGSPVWQDAVPRPDPLLPNGNTSPYEVNGETYTVLAAHRGYREQGIASWYGMKFQGRSTANGEIFDVFAATAAHRSLPIPSYVRVTNLGNQQRVVLRVNDRGPFHPDRLIDLSYGAAKQLGFAEQGTALVLIESIDLAGVDDRRASPALTYRYLQLGAYQSPDTAHQVVNEVNDRWGYPATTSPVDVEGNRLHRVRVGPFADPQALERARTVLMEGGHMSPQRLP